eukprot:scaffold219406_cov21-Tisochrysis_lutea.AAC.1
MAGVSIEVECDLERCEQVLILSSDHLELWLFAVRDRELFTFPYPGHISMPCITDGVVLHTLS